MSARAPKKLHTARAAAIFACTSSILIGACHAAEAPPAESIRPVRTLTVEEQVGGETVTLTGRIEAQEEVSLAFRTGGRMIERTVNIGDRVRTGQIIARIEAVTPQNAVHTARANLSAAMAQLTEARNNFDRQERMLAQGVSTRQNFDRALQTKQTAQAQVDAAQAQLNTARNELTYTELVADSDGTVTARGAEPGEVVAAGQMIVKVARHGGRDAVFDVPSRVIQTAPMDPEVKVVLTTDPNVKATGRVREVSPQADPVTRTFAVRVGLNDPPSAMRLGSTVSGSIHLGGVPGIEIPASALTTANGQPAVWVVDPTTSTVSRQNIDVERFELSDVTVAQGLNPGDIVVTAGVQSLRPGQKVRLLKASP